MTTASHPDQLVLIGADEALLDSLDWAHAEVALRRAATRRRRTEERLRTDQAASTCRCDPAPWLSAPSWCWRCGRPYRLTSSPAAADGVEVGAPARLQPPGA